MACEQHIIDGIRSGEYKSTKRLGEVRIARTLGLGQSHVRSALARLTHLGLLERKHRSGTYVRELSMEELIGLTHVRALLEGFACRLACRYATLNDLKELEDLGRSLDERLSELTPENYRLVEKQDLAFHEMLIRLSQNSVLVRTLDEQQLILTCLRRGFDLPWIFLGNDSHAPTHLDLLQAVKDRDPEQADRCMRKHLIGCFKAEMHFDEIIDL
jgi:DNA-binding GntR family transcriptional regulator